MADHFLNIGCGSDRPEGWTNADKGVIVRGSGVAYADLRMVLPWPDDTFTLIVANHVLSDLTHHELPHALRELRRVLKPGGVLRILVPDFLRAVHHFEQGDPDWFPQDDRTEGLDARLCTFVMWYGESRSVFTRGYLRDLLAAAGFAETVALLPVGATACSDPEWAALIVSLDGDRTTALRVEAQK